MKRLISIIVLIGLLANCQSASSIKQDPESQVIPQKSCNDVASNQRLDCVGGKLKRDQIILNDPGKMISMKIVAKDTYCTRVEMTWEYGSTLPEEYRMTRIHTIKVCRYADFWDRLSDNIVFGGIAYGAGFITGVGVMAK